TCSRSSSSWSPRRASWSSTGTTRCLPARASPATARSSTRAPGRPPASPRPSSQEPHGHHDRHRHPRARGVRGLRGDLEAAEHASHAADVRHQRDPRHRSAGRAARPLLSGGRAQQGAAGDRDHLRDDQHRRRVPGHRPDARDVQGRSEGEAEARAGRGQAEVIAATSFFQDHHFIEGLYIVDYVLFIVGLLGLAGPRTPAMGNRLAAVGMLIAFVATLLIAHVIKGGSDVALMALGIGIGTAVGIPAARSVKMTAMPQMVALFNGVGGGAVALIAWVEFRRRFPEGGQLWNLKAEIPSLFAAIVGSISFWGSNIAFGKLQEILPGRPIQLPGQRILNGALALTAVVSAVVLASGVHSQALFVLGILVAAAILGNMVVLPIGGADMPVVISLLNAFTGISAAATGIALANTALIVAGMIVGASGSILTDQMAKAMNRSIPSIIAGGFGGSGTAVGG